MPFMRRLWILGAAILVLFVAAACASLPLDSSWGDVSVIGTTPNILFSFADRIVQIDPTDGSLVEQQDADGNLRMTQQGVPCTWTVETTTNTCTGQSTGGTALHFYTRPVATDNRTLVAAAYEGKLFQIDVPAARILNPDGATLPGHIAGNLLLTDNLLYVPIIEGGIVALNLPDLSEAWRFESDNPKGVWSQPLLIDDTLFVSAMNHNLYALNAQTGSQKWALDLEGALASRPVYANDVLYVGSFGNKLFKVTLDGTIAAQYETSDWVWGAPAVADDMVYVGDLDGTLYALHDAGSTFEVVWSRKVASGAIRMTPLVTDDTIVVGSRDHNLYWISRETGEELIKREMQGEVLSDIVLLEPNDAIRDPLLIVSTTAHEQALVAFTLDRGDTRWVYKF